jgi:adenylate cyclase
VDKYEGDAIIAFWNAPLDLSDHGLRAVRAAIRCQEKLAEMRPAFKQRTGKELFMRVGLNSGPAVVGNMGSKTRFDYTMLGDAVNLAARLEGVNKQFGTYTMISANTLALLPEDSPFACRELSRIAVVGKKIPVTVYEPMRRDEFEAKKGILQAFADALALYYGGKFPAALAAFSRIAEKDPPAARYAAQCERLIASPPSEWAGVWTMTEK